MVEHSAVNRVVVGSSPTRGVFLNIRLRGQAVKTSPFHGGNTGSSPVWVVSVIVFTITIWDLSSAGRASALQAEGHRFEPCRSHLFICRCGSIGRAADL